MIFTDEQLDVLRQYSALYKRHGIVFQPTQEGVPGWKTLAIVDEIYFSVAPDPLGRGYSLTSRDSSTFPIPKTTVHQQTFRDESGAVAIYPSEKLAYQHGLVLVYDVYKVLPLYEFYYLFDLYRWWQRLKKKHPY